jgi:positive regulator of sigma E activity
MNQDHHYTHEGVVSKIDSGIVTVTISCASACSSCHAKGACSGLDHSMKNIEVKSSSHFTIGENVVVAISKTNSFKALFLGYLLPFTILLMTLVVTGFFRVSEIAMATAALLFLSLYYLTLSLFKDQISKQFQFVIHRKNS